MATIIPFPVQGGPWAQHESDALVVLQQALEKRGLATSVEVGITDEADPWAVFCSREDGRALAHVARGRSGVILVWADGLIVRAPYLASLTVAVSRSIDQGETPLEHNR